MFPFWLLFIYPCTYVVPCIYYVVCLVNVRLDTYVHMYMDVFWTCIHCPSSTVWSLLNLSNPSWPVSKIKLICQSNIALPGLLITIAKVHMHAIYCRYWLLTRHTQHVRTKVDSSTVCRNTHFREPKSTSAHHNRRIQLST